MTTWITRSQPGADRQAAELRENGYDVLVAPVIGIEATRASEPEGRFDYVIFLSEQAVVNGGSLRYCTGAAVYAVGGRTSHALSARGIEALHPEEASSEGLVSLLDGLVETDAKILIVAGEGGRKDLLRALVERGAKVAEYLCYRRVAANLTGEVVARLTNVDTVLVASQDGFRHVARLWFESGGSPTVRILAASRRIAELAGELGFENVKITAGAATEHWLTALEDGNG